MDLDDYRGPFNPDLKWEDFSKDLLIRLLKACSNLYNGMPGFFMSAIEKRYGFEVTKEISDEAYAIGTRMQFIYAQRELGLGNTVGDCLKYQQFGIDVATMDVKAELKNENLGIITIRNCPGLLYWERHDRPEMWQWACHELASREWKNVAHWINPRIKCTPIKLAPRRSKDDFCCQWEYRMEPPE